MMMSLSNPNTAASRHMSSKNDPDVRVMKFKEEMMDIVASKLTVDFVIFNISAVVLRIADIVLVVDCCSSALDFEEFDELCKEEANDDPKDTTSLNDDNFLALTNSSEIPKEGNEGGFTENSNVSEQNNKASHTDPVAVIPLPKIKNVKKGILEISIATFVLDERNPNL